MLIGFGLDVPSGSGVVDAQPKPPFCGSVRALQQMLQDLGFYAGGVDGSWGPLTVEAIKSFASSLGIHLQGITADFCQILISEWQKKKGAPPTQRRDPFTYPSPMYISPSTAAFMTGRGGPVESGTGPTAPADVADKKSESWWSKQTAATKYAVIGGVAVAAIGGYMYAKKRGYVKNPSRSLRGRLSERDRGRKWFNSLSNYQKWEIGDQFVLGTFDWRDWSDEKPSREFLNGAEDARIYWETTR